MKKKGLFSKLVLVYTLIIAMGFFILAAFLSIWFQQYYFNQRKTQIMSEANVLSPTIVDYLNNNISLNTVNDSISTVASYFNSDVLLQDQYGYVYAVSNSKYNSLVDNQLFPEDFSKLRNGFTIEKKGNYNNLLSNSVHIYEVPITYYGTFKGTIIVNTSLSDISSALSNAYLIIWIAVILAIIISCIILYYLTQKIIIKPLAKINNVAGKFAKGEVEKRVDIATNDEIGELAQSFNTMADNLEKVEMNRRNFISNVSHEIRSPITSIKGFIGGILDGVIPAEKEKYYLSIANEEIHRLTRLVNDLLDLSTIDAGQFSLKKEKIDINEIIRLTVIKFETKIREKKVNVDVYFDEENTFVDCDRDRMIQVVTNLLDNAIKYVKKGGNIKINTKIKSEKLLISVFNDGPKISEEDLSHIWDRFYKSDKSRTSKVSTGLGLPIVRSILTQHGEDIWVENKGSEGVTFTFSLKRI
jgi:signal transduction histidine kinase